MPKRTLKNEYNATETTKKLKLSSITNNEEIFPQSPASTKTHPTLKHKIKFTSSLSKDILTTSSASSSKNISTCSLSLKSTVPPQSEQSQKDNSVPHHQVESQLEFKIVSTNHTTTSIKEDSTDHLLLSSWKLPQEILKKYHNVGVVKLFDWQVECLCTGNVLGRFLFYFKLFFQINSTTINHITIS